MRDFDLEIAGNFRFSVYDARKHPGAWSNYVVRIHFSPANGKLKSAALALAAVTLVLGNVAFLLLDRALASLLRVYRLLWQPRLHRMLGKR